MEILTDADREAYFDGYKIVDAAIADRNLIYFMLAETGGDGSRILRLTLSETEAQWARNNLTGYDKDTLLIAMAYPDNRSFVIDEDGLYFISPKGPQPRIPSMAQGGPLDGGVVRIGAIGRKKTLLLTSSGSLMMRDQEENWTLAAPRIDVDHPSWVHFHDFDADAEGTIYVAGDDGLYHFDGQSWSKADHPADAVFSVCRAPDGYVYATTFEPTRIALFRGRDGRFEKLFEDRRADGHANPLKDIVWHDNMIWASSWSELWAWKDGKPVNHGGPTGGRLVVHDDLLMCAGVFGCSVRQAGEAWQTWF